MAKVSFTKLGLKVNQAVNKIVINEQEIEVKQYLPINDRLALISEVLNDAYDGANYPNWIKIDMLTELAIVYAYTNIAFTDKQKEDVCKLYDLLKSTDVMKTIIDAIPVDEYVTIVDDIHVMAQAIYDQKNSAVGIVEAITNDYSNLDLDANTLREKMADPETMTLLKDIMTKLG